MTATRLREHVYQVLDQVLATGEPVDIERRGKRLRIVPVERPGKLRNLKRRRYLRGDPEDLVHLDWSGEWRP